MISVHPCAWVPAALLLAAPAMALEPTTSLSDTSRFEIFDHGQPVGHEEFVYVPTGDSVVIHSQFERRMRRSDGRVEPLVKRVWLTLGRDDMALRRYASELQFDGHTSTKGLIAGDTTMSVYTQHDRQGLAENLVQPPGRYFVIEPMAFTLFDVIGRSLHEQSFSSRPVAIVTLGQEDVSSDMTARDDGFGTLRWGGRTLQVQRYTLSDSTGAFTLWVSGRGELLRLENRGSDIVVLREAPAPPKRRPAARPRAKR